MSLFFCLSSITADCYRWNYSDRDAANVVAATIIHAYESTPLVAPPSHGEATSRTGPSAHSIAKPDQHVRTPAEGQDTNARAAIFQPERVRYPLASLASEQQSTFSVTAQHAPKSAPLPPVTTSTTVKAVPAVVSTYTPTPRQLKQVCASNLSNHGPWDLASRVGCKRGRRCPARLHICKRYWHGIKHEGDNATCSQGGDGVSHWDRKLRMQVIHFRPSCYYELPDSEGKVRGCRGSCSRAHPADSGSEGWMVRLKQYWRGGRQ